MSNEVVKVDKSITSYKVGSEEVKLSDSIVRQFICKGDTNLTNSEVVNFISLCKFRKLNPFLNEAYPVKYGNNAAQLIVGAEAFKRKAEENPNFEGYRGGVIVARGKEIVELEGAFFLKTDQLLGGWCEVYVKGRKFPVVSKVSFDEYNKKKSLWNEKPGTMIRKVAIVQALREAFPGDLGALYSNEELGVDDNSNNIASNNVNNMTNNNVNIKQEIIFDEIPIQEVQEVKEVKVQEVKEVKVQDEQIIEGCEF